MFSLEQYEALAALDKSEGFSAASRALGKSHTAILALLERMESTSGVTLLDRTGYRVRLTPLGHRLAAEAHKVLQSHEKFQQTLNTLRSGTEGELTVVYDAILPIELYLNVIREIQSKFPATRVKLHSEFLKNVVALAEQQKTSVLFSLFPPQGPGWKLSGKMVIDMYLCSAPQASFARGDHIVDAHHLEECPWVYVQHKESLPTLPTHGLRCDNETYVADFNAKKAFIKGKLGIGWLPYHLIKDDLEKGDLAVMRWQGLSVHPMQVGIWHKKAGLVSDFFIEQILAGMGPMQKENN